VVGDDGVAPLGGRFCCVVGVECVAVLGGAVCAVVDDDCVSPLGEAFVGGDAPIAPVERVFWLVDVETDPAPAAERAREAVDAPLLAL